MSNIRDKYFYSGIIDISSITIEIADMDMEPHERKHLLELAESNVHHTILDTILSHLSEDDKKEFLKHVRDEDNENVWKLLKEKVEGIEDKIKKAAEDIRTQLHADIEETKKSSKTK